MDPKVIELYSFVLEKLPDESTAKRARLSRALATIIADEKAALQLNALADECDRIDRLHVQLVLNFQRAS